jgi:hypothetical protein
MWTQLLSLTLRNIYLGMKSWLLLSVRRVSFRSLQLKCLTFQDGISLTMALSCPWNGASLNGRNFRIKHVTSIRQLRCSASHLIWRRNAISRIQAYRLARKILFPMDAQSMSLVRTRTAFIPVKRTSNKSVGKAEAVDRIRDAGRPMPSRVKWLKT